MSSDPRIDDLFERVKTLEDLVQRITQAFIVAPQPKQEEKREWTWNPGKIKWTQDTGAKGPYEKSDDVNSLDFKTMLKDLGEHGGKLNRDGRFYWTFKNGSTVGRTMLK